MDCEDDFLLRLYRGCYELEASKFADHVMELLATTFMADSARYVRTTRDNLGQLRVTSAVMHNEPIDMVLDWETINKNDVVLQAVLQSPGVATIFHAQTLYAAPDKAIVLDYARRYGHANGVVIAATGEGDGNMDGLSLYRSDSNQHFGAAERMRLQSCMPHLQNAFRISARLALGRIYVTSEPYGVAIVGGDGLVRFSTPSYNAAVHEEWPHTSLMRLPPLLASAVCEGKQNYFGRRSRFDLHLSGATVVITAHPSSVVLQLTNREAAVAVLYGEGASYKEVARQLGIAPTTVRNMLQSIYRKLGMKDKGELATYVATGRIVRRS